MKLGRPGVHPCLPLPRAERERLEAAFLFAVGELKAGEPPQCWLDAVLATEAALALLPAQFNEPEGCRVARVAHDALHDYADGHGPRGKAIEACGAFVPYYQALLAAVTWRRIGEAQRDIVGRWRRDGEARRVAKPAI